MLKQRWLNWVMVVFLCLACVLTGLVGAPAERGLALSETVVISQVYGGGGNSGATFRNDFIELFNRGNTPVDLSGWSVQYAAAASSAWSVTPLSGTLAPGQYYLVQEAQGSGGTVNLPTPDAVGSINMAAASGKVALVQSTTAFGTACPTAASVDFLGYGTANCSEAAALDALTNSTAARRNTSGCMETDANPDDFSIAAPAPRNSSSPTFDCAASEAAPAVVEVYPPDEADWAAFNATLRVNFSEQVALSGAWFNITCSSSGNRQPADTVVASMDLQSFSVNPSADFIPGESCTVTILADQVTDTDTQDPPDALPADYVWSFSIPAQVSGCGGLFFSEYVEGSSNNKALEIFNGTGADVDLTGYQVLGYFNGNATPTYTLSLSGLLLNGDVYVIAHSSAVLPIVPDLTAGNFNVTGFNGDDTLILRDPGGAVLDVIGQAGHDPGAEWGTGPTSTADNTLRRKLRVASGDATAPELFDPEVEWDGFSTDSFNDLGTHSAQCRCATIPAIQGAGHKSTCSDIYHIRGVVTAVDATGYYLQTASPDGDQATSDAIYVFTSAAPGVAAGDELWVRGVVQEYYPGGVSTGNLSITEITAPVVTLLSTGNALPAPVAIGLGGRIPPDQVIEDDASGDVETQADFDPDTDGIDFYESLEAMRVQINDARVVGPSQYFASTDNWQFVAVGDGGAAAGTFAARGALARLPADANPERLILEGRFTAFPAAYAVGDLFAAPIVGVMGYSYGNFKLFPTESMPAFVSGLLAPETTPLLPAEREVRLATFNVQNVHPADPARLAAIAQNIVQNLGAPDILALQEMQDNTGPVDDGVVDASATFSALVAAISAAGGPAYEYRQINPADGQDGGEPGGNIRVGFLFRADRIGFVDRPGGDAATPVGITLGTGGPEFTTNPGRIDPTNPAFSGSRKPLAAEFTFDGEKFFVITAHFNSKSGDSPLFGRIQPPALVSEGQRVQQAQIMHDFVASILALDAQAQIIVLGDFNDFDFSAPLAALRGSPAPVLYNLFESLPPEERYTYLFAGNAQALDHILVSPAIHHYAAPRFDAVHLNAEFASAARSSDHDPLMAAFDVIPWASADFSDLPVSYGLAWHRSPRQIWLGVGADDDAAAPGGADNATDDGVTLAAQRWTPGATILLTVNITGGSGWLSGWFDWNADGDFEDAGEMAINRAVDAGPNPISVEIPGDALVGNGSAATIWARFRLYESAAEPAGVLLPGGIDAPQAAQRSGGVSGGEVEDYAFSFSPTPVTLVSFHAHALPLRWEWLGFLGLALLVGLWRRMMFPK